MNTENRRDDRQLLTVETRTAVIVEPSVNVSVSGFLVLEELFLDSRWKSKLCSSGHYFEVFSLAARYSIS